METKNLTCINCPLGCALTVEMNGESILHVTGNTCKRGEVYAQREVTAPVRMVTSTVRVIGGNLPVLSVKTREAIPREMILACVQELKKISLQAPVYVGDVVLENVVDTGIDIVATRNVEVVAREAGGMYE